MNGSTYTLVVEDAPRDEDVQLLAQGLTEHSILHTGKGGFLPLGVFLRDEQGRTVGGAWGYVNWNWLYINLVWLPDTVRGGGYGRQLITELEETARQRGCQYVHLDTFSYQARPFYEKLGYEVFATLDNYPQGHKRFFMKKSL